MLIDGRPLQLRVEGDVRALVSMLLPFPCHMNTGTDLGGRLRLFAAAHFLQRNGRDIHTQIDTVQERLADLAMLFCEIEFVRLPYKRTFFVANLRLDFVSPFWQRFVFETYTYNMSYFEKVGFFE